MGLDSELDRQRELLADKRCFLEREAEMLVKYIMGLKYRIVDMEDAMEGLAELSRGKANERI